MKTLKFIMLDMRIGTLREWPRGFLVFFLFILSSAALFRLPSLWGTGPVIFSFGDYLVNSFAGMKEYVFDPEDPFNFPAFWMLLFLLVAFFTLKYPYQDLMGVGKHLMLLSGNRVRWWASKCIWVIVNVLLYFAIAAAAIGAWVLVSQGEFSLAVSQETPGLLDFETGLLRQPPWDIFGFLIAAVAMTIAVCLAQLLAALYLKPVIAFLCTASLLFLSAYFKSMFLVGNYLMAARSDAFIQYGLSWQAGIIISCAAIAAVSILGGLMFKRMDVFDRGRLA